MGMGMGLGLGLLQDQGRGLSNSIDDHNGYYDASLYAASLDVKPANLYELPVDAIHLLRENLVANDNNSCLGYSCLPRHDEVVDYPAALVLRKPLWQQDLVMQHQRPRFESLPDSTNLQLKGGMPFEEHQAALDAQVLSRGMSCNGNEAVQQFQVHLQSDLENASLSAIGGSMMDSFGDIEEKNLQNTVPEEEVVGCDFNSQPPHAHSSSLMNYCFPPPESAQSLAVALLRNQRNQLYASCLKEPSAKRPRTSGCYTLEDVIQKLPRDAGLGLNTVRSNQTPSWNFFPATPQFSPDFNLPSPRLSCSSASSSLERDSSENQHQHLLYRKPAYVSVEPQSIAARHRRKKISEKIRCLEKLIPLGSKLDTARMLEEASKYVKFLQAQVHLLEYISSSPSPSDSKESIRSAETLNPSLTSTTNVFDRGSGMSSSWNVNASSLTNALVQQRSSKSLSAQQMLHILVTSPGIQRKLFSEEKCMGTVEEYQMLFSTEALMPYNFSNFHSMDTIPTSD